MRIPVTLDFAKHRSALGYALWELFEEAKKMGNAGLANRCLETALYNTNQAHSEVVKLENKIRKGTPNYNQYMDDIKKQICFIQNNLAYYLSEKALQGNASEDEKCFALRLADDLEKRWIDVPERAKSFRDTISKVKERIPGKTCRTI